LSVYFSWVSLLNNDILKNLKLIENYPNPFNSNTKIKYELSVSSRVKIEIFNLSGQRIEILQNKHMPPGVYEIDFNANNLPSGVYLCRIEAGKYQDVKKMILLR
jgi:uncharacterized protein YdgA (DUF945 family)